MSKYNSSFMSNCETPFTEFHSFEQEMVNEDFEYAPTWYNDIEQEISFGSLEFKKINARINQIMDSKVGDRINDDYRKIIFRDLNFKPELGSRYRFDNNIWIVYSTDNIKANHSSCYVRRCNNTINLQDEYGLIHEEPCIIDIKPTKSGITEQEYMSTPIARQVLMYQLNKWTKPLFINSRIMFNRQVYKIGAIMELDRTETFNPDSIKFVKCYVDNDLVNEYDNLDLQVADYKIFDYSIYTNKNLIGAINSSGVLNASVYLGNQEVEEKVYWYSDNEKVVTINKITGEYKMLELGEANIFVKMSNNENFYSQIDVKVTQEQEVDIYINTITPTVDYIPLGQKQVFEVYETLNGNRIDTVYDIEVSGMEDKYYKLEKSDNTFTITNKLQNDLNLLKVECINKRNGSKLERYIELGGLF